MVNGNAIILGFLGIMGVLALISLGVYSYYINYQYEREIGS